MADGRQEDGRAQRGKGADEQGEQGSRWSAWSRQARRRLSQKVFERETGRGKQAMQTYPIERRKQIIALAEKYVRYGSGSSQDSLRNRTAMQAVVEVK